MQLEYLSKLERDFRKFSGFMLPDAIRHVSHNASAFLSNPDICLPIDDKNSPVCFAFGEIIKNKKVSKTSETFFNNIMNVTSSEIFQGEALRSIYFSFEENVMNLEAETHIKIMENIKSIQAQHYNDIALLRCFFNILASLYSSHNANVRNNAIQSIEALILSFVTFVNSSESKANIDIQQIKSFSDFYGIEDGEYGAEYNKIFCIILKDLYSMVYNNEFKWFKSKLSKLDAFNVLTNTLLAKPNLFCFSPMILRVISKVIFICSDITFSIKKASSLCRMFMNHVHEAVLSIFLVHLHNLKDTYSDSSQSVKALRSLKFFRRFLCSSNDIFINFCELCDNSFRHLIDLYSHLHKISEIYSNSKEQIDLSLSIKKSQKLFLTAPIEITSFHIRGIFESKKESAVEIMRVIWPFAIKIIQNSMTFVSSSTSYVPLSALHFMIVYSKENNLDKVRTASLISFLDILKYESKYRREIIQSAENALTALIEGSPSALTCHWNSVVRILSDFRWEPVSLEFSVAMSNDDMVELETALVLLAKNCDDSKVSVWIVDFVTALLHHNCDRFSCIWPHVESLFLLESNIEQFLTILDACINKDSEMFICRTCQILMNGASFSLENKVLILTEISNVILSKGHLLNEGWIYIIHSINPASFNTEDLVKISSRCFQNLCSVNLRQFDINCRNLLLDVLFEFVKQDIYQNEALNILGYLWNFTSTATSASTWIDILKKTSIFIEDKRENIASCVAKTYFSITMASVDSIDDKVFDYIFDDYIPYLLNKINDGHCLNEWIQQTIFYDTIHLIKVLNPRRFIRTILVEQIVLAHEKLMLTSSNLENIANCLFFYEEIFGIETSQEMRNFVFESILRIADGFIVKYPATCHIFGSFGRFIRIAVPIFNQKFTNTDLEYFIKLFEKLIFDAKVSPNCLPPTTHKVLDSINEMFPLDNEKTLVVFKFLNRCLRVPNERLQQVASSKTISILELVNKDIYVDLFLEVSDVFISSDSFLALMEKFLDLDITVNEDDVPKLFLCLANASLTSEKARKRLYSMFCNVSNDLKIKYLELIKEDINSLMIFLSSLINPESELFDKNTAFHCTEIAINLLITEFKKETDDFIIESHLKYLLSLKTYGPVYDAPEYETSKHLMYIVPYFADLVLSPSECIRRLVREVLLKISQSVDGHKAVNSATSSSDDHNN